LGYKLPGAKEKQYPFYRNSKPVARNLILNSRIIKFVINHFLCQTMILFRQPLIV
jgi:hypothetical protein